MTNTNYTLACSWCGNVVEPGDGYRLAEHEGDRGAVFCRLEHIVPWAIQGAHWSAGEPVDSPASDAAGQCSYCGRELDALHLLLVRHRAEHRIPDRFCGVDHLLQWAKEGGRWRA
jgi:ribosomal protein L24E